MPTVGSIDARKFAFSVFTDRTACAPNRPVEGRPMFRANVENRVLSAGRGATFPRRFVPDSLFWFPPIRRGFVLSPFCCLKVQPPTEVSLANLGDG